MIKLVLFIFFASNLAEASRILFLFPSPSKSHLIVVKGLSTTLAERGHDVTVVSPFPLEKPMKNYRDIKVAIPQDMHDLSESMFKNTQPVYLSFPRLLRNLFAMGNDMLDSNVFKKVMNEEKFDLVIIGMFFNNYLLGVGDHFKCPTMMLSVSGPQTFTNTLVGNPIEVSAVNHMFTGLAPDTFKNRLINYFAYGVDFMMMNFMNYQQKKYYDLKFPADQGYISYEESQKNLSMILVNSHFSQGDVRPHVPAMVEVGGLQIKQTQDKLPQNVQEFLDGAGEHGAIFFSLGSNAKTTFLSREKIDDLLSIFAKLKQRVIMKWESDELEGKPDNVFIGKWLPQDGILAHKNIKVFITHCGLGSIAEAKYHGVPVLGIPIAIDQLSNANTAVQEGWGLRVDFSAFSKIEIENALKQLLEDPKYFNKAKSLSTLYRDRPQSARETAVYWVEYVIRHRGAPHLRYRAADMNFFQRNSIDVIGFLLAVLYISFKIIKVIFKLILSCLCKKDKGKNKKVKKH